MGPQLSLPLIFRGENALIKFPFKIIEALDLILFPHKQYFHWTNANSTSPKKSNRKDKFFHIVPNVRDVRETIAF